MLKAVIFDFDGVIADSEELHYKALNEVLKRYGVDVPKSEHWAKYLGYTDRENIEAVSRDYRMNLTAQQVSSIMEHKKLVFDEMAAREVVIIEGVEEFIRRLIASRIRMAICSGALRSDIELMLDGAGFADRFEVIVSAEDVSKGKPDPQGYLLALERLSQNKPLRASECVVIEDSHWGLEAALAAGMCPVAVTTTYHRQQLEEKAKKVVNRLDELRVDDLEKICGS